MFAKLASIRTHVNLVLAGLSLTHYEATRGDLDHYVSRTVSQPMEGNSPVILAIHQEPAVVSAVVFPSNFKCFLIVLLRWYDVREATSDVSTTSEVP